MLTAEIEVFAHAHLAEQFTRFRTLHDAAARDAGWADAAQLVAVAYDLAAVGQEAGDRIEQSGLAGAVEPHHRDELALMDMDRHILERLRLAVMDADILHLEQRHLVLEAGFRSGRDFDRAAEIHPAHGFIAHHLARAAGDESLAALPRQPELA